MIKAHTCCKIFRLSSSINVLLPYSKVWVMIGNCTCKYVVDNDYLKYMKKRKSLFPGLKNSGIFIFYFLRGKGADSNHISTSYMVCSLDFINL